MTRSVTLVVCAAPLADRAGEVIDAMQARGWAVRLVTTPAARQWIDAPQIEATTGVIPVSEYRQPRQPRQRHTPDAVIACPITFNTTNKLAVGAMDNYALGVLCESVATSVPLFAVPMVNERLWRHPAWSTSLSTLAEAGVSFVDPHTGKVGDPVAVQSGTGAAVAGGFDPAWLIDAVEG